MLVEKLSEELAAARNKEGILGLRGGFLPGPVNAEPDGRHDGAQ